MNESELYGSWGVDTGYEANPDEVRIVFRPDKTGAINPHTDEIKIEWSYEDEDGLKLKINEHWMGPFKIEIEEKDFPMGKFTSLNSRGPLLPFGLNQFQKMTSNE